MAWSLVIPLNAGEGCPHLYVFPAWTIVPASYCDSAGCKVAVGVGPVVVASCNGSDGRVSGASGAYGAWVAAFQRVYGGLGFLVRGESGAGAFASSEAPRGVHPEPSYSGSVAFAWSCSRDTGQPSGGVVVLRHVLSVSVEPDVSLVC